MDVFDRYIAHGREALTSHPDYGDLDDDTLAVDTVASILHAIYGRERGVAAEEGARHLLDRALVCWRGDYESMGDELTVPPLTRLKRLVARHRTADELRRAEIRAVLAEALEGGASYADAGHALGVSRQAAHKLAGR